MGHWDYLMLLLLAGRFLSWFCFSPIWPGTPYVAQASLELVVTPALAFRALYLQV